MGACTRDVDPCGSSPRQNSSGSVPNNTISIHVYIADSLGYLVELNFVQETTAFFFDALRRIVGLSKVQSTGENQANHDAGKSVD